MYMRSNSIHLKCNVIQLVLTSVMFIFISNTQAQTCDTSLKGFASSLPGTTGGGTVTAVTVTTIDQLRASCAGTQPAVIKVSGTIATGPKPVLIGSNKSIIGAVGALISGGFNVPAGTSNIILRNLIIKGGGFGSLPGDTLRLIGATNVWIDHCDFSDAADGLLDITKGSDLVTVSWNKFSYTQPTHPHRLASLVGDSASAFSTDRGKLRVTFHNNLWGTNVWGRMPRVRFGHVHIVNNFYNAPGNDYIIGIGTEAALLIENNYFNNMKNPISIQETGPAFVTEIGNIFFNTLGEKVLGAVEVGVVPLTTPPYQFLPTPANLVQQQVVTCSGAVIGTLI